MFSGDTVELINDFVSLVFEKLRQTHVQRDKHDKYDGEYKPTEGI